MPTFAVYQQADFPPVLKWQAIAFMRVEWSFIFAGSGKFTAETYPAACRPVHFAATEGDALLSYAATLHIDLEHAGQTYKCYGFGNMFTFPPYRREGYGQQVLRLATDVIQQSNVDIALLFCDSTLESFYARSGWHVVRTPVCVGKPGTYEPHDVTPMMLFVSEKGRQGQRDFEQQPLYIDSPW